MSGGASSHQDRRGQRGEVVFDVTDLGLDLGLGLDEHNGAEEDEIDALPPPPGYDEVVVETERMEFTPTAGVPSIEKVENNIGDSIGGSSSSSEPSRLDSFVPTKNVQDSSHIQKKANTNTETVQVIHKIQRGDTLLSIARKYAADVSFCVTNPFHGRMREPHAYSQPFSISPFSHMKSYISIPFHLQHSLPILGSYKLVKV